MIGTLLLAILLPADTIPTSSLLIDMVETAENVWSDSCVCAIVNKRT